MDLEQINRVMRTVESHAQYDDEWVDIRLTAEEYEEVFAVTQMLKMAEMTNHKLAQAAFPKLVKAVQLVLAIEEHPFQNPTERVKLAPKTRNQLHAALKVAGVTEEAPASP
jgi:hypothetical protein